MTLQQKLLSHYPILNEIVINFDIKDVLEFGSGFGSTKIFCENVDNVVTVEMQSEEWFNKVSDRFKKDIEDGKLLLKYIQTLPDEDCSKAIKEVPDKNFDMIFVDGSRDSRWCCMEWAKEKTDLIVCHDSEEKCYMYDKVEKDGWFWRDIKIYKIWTSIMTKREDIIEFFDHNFEYEEMKKKYKKMM